MSTLFSKTYLKVNRGWTDQMISDLLGECDHRPKNPFCDTWRRPQLYDADRVVQAESTEEFKSFKATSSRAKSNE
jgi:hypothetical protein